MLLGGEDSLAGVLRGGEACGSERGLHLILGGDGSTSERPIAGLRRIDTAANVMSDGNERDDRKLTAWLCDGDGSSGLLHFRPRVS